MNYENFSFYSDMFEYQKKTTSCILHPVFFFSLPFSPPLLKKWVRNTTGVDMECKRSKKCQLIFYTSGLDRRNHRPMH